MEESSFGSQESKWLVKALKKKISKSVVAYADVTAIIDT